MPTFIWRDPFSSLLLAQQSSIAIALALIKLSYQATMDLWMSYGSTRPLGDSADALEIVDDLKKQVKPGDETPYCIALIDLDFGEMDSAFYRLNQGLDNFSGAPFSLKYDPIWNSIRSDSRFVDPKSEIRLALSLICRTAGG